MYTRPKCLVFPSRWKSVPSALDFNLFVIIEEIVCSFLLILCSFLFMYFEMILFDLYTIVLTKTFFFSKRVSLFFKDDFLLWQWSLFSLQSLYLKIELSKCIPSTLVKDWYNIIFPRLSTLFSHALAHGSLPFKKIIFAPEAFSYSFRMGLSLAKQLMSPNKMVESSAKFIFWFLGLLHVPLSFHAIIS